MDALIIEGTEFTPDVVMDPGSNRFEMSGESRPENASKFYEAILNWMDNYHSLRYWRDSKFDDNSNSTVFEFRLEYFNSTSAKFILDILKKIEIFRKDDMNVTVKWYYEELDIDMKESGEEFASMTGIPFEYIVV
ncbi:MAG TPA: DUF1987 domain-containing protein [Flavobacteriales bacterium]|nr:DUF1987 domain-containing protein [Flavobacteriales bacterium]